MGKGYVSISNDLSASFFNPAGIGNINGIELNNSYASPFYMLEDSYHLYNGIGCRLNKYIQFSISRLQWVTNEEISVLGETVSPKSSISTITLASEPLRGLFIGFNLNYFVWDLGPDHMSKAPYFDFGAIKKFNVYKGEIFSHTISVGSSISNFSNSTVTMDFSNVDETVKLPIISRFGANYHLGYNKQFLIRSLNTLEFLLQSEVQYLLNCEYHTAYKIGGELFFLDLLALRAGYFQEEIYNYGLPENNYSLFSDFTFGFGIQIPFYKLTKIPIRINFDYTSLPQVSYTEGITEAELGKFSNYTIKINWILKQK